MAYIVVPEITWLVAGCKVVWESNPKLLPAEQKWLVQQLRMSVGPGSAIVAETNRDRL
jgi:hypothetical protein